MEHLDELRRAYSRTEPLPRFHPNDHTWRIYLRAAVEKVLERHDLPEFAAAHAEMKEFSEHLPREGEDWHRLLEAVEQVLAAD